MKVGETWLPRLSESTSGVSETDIPLLKLFEFLTASMCLYITSEDGVIQRESHQLYHLAAPQPTMET